MRSLRLRGSGGPEEEEEEEEDMADGLGGGQREEALRRGLWRAAERGVALCAEEALGSVAADSGARKAERRASLCSALCWGGKKGVQNTGLGCSVAADSGARQAVEDKPLLCAAAGGAKELDALHWGTTE
jgi:hypothetical protein